MVLLVVLLTAEHEERGDHRRRRGMRAGDHESDSESKMIRRAFLDELGSTLHSNTSDLVTNLVTELMLVTRFEVASRFEVNTNFFINLVPSVPQ